MIDGIHLEVLKKKNTFKMKNGFLRWLFVSHEKYYHILTVWKAIQLAKPFKIVK